MLYQKPVHSDQGRMTTPAAIVVAALNADNGQEIWQRSLLDLSADDVSRLFYTTDITIAGSLLYAIISTPVNGLVVALDAGSGRILWKYAEQIGTIYSPIAANGAFYMQVGHTTLNILQALDGQSGKLLWSVSTGDYKLVQIAATD